VSQFYARGSLENLLTNRDLKLDDMFVSSLIFDAIKGMIFLHDSEIGFHGRLKTSSCLVDSRWCLKLADFGLCEFAGGSAGGKDLRELMTRAPELLSSNSPPGTQKGDVYSFGILLFEVYARNGPFGMGYEFTAATIPIYEDILTKLRDPQKHIRPSLNSFRAPECVRETIVLCWHKEPGERPDMRMIRLRLKELKWGLKSNIFDHMMSLMEKHACNLEELVQERTNQLMEEKKKTENLLLRMLPK
jgi:guanylate cyclase